MIGSFLETLLGGLFAGVLYSLVALGFVLIFKASGVFNYAQGAMVFLAGLVLAWAVEKATGFGIPTWGAVALSVLAAAAVMALTSWAVVRFVLEPLVQKDSLIIFMATIGVTFILESLCTLIFGFDVYKLNFLPNDTIIFGESVIDGGVLVNSLDAYGGVAAGILVALLAAFFHWTKTGRALRAVADDHGAAQSVGIPIGWVWFVVWLVAGLVALVAAAIWGTKIGVQYSLMFLALKALPVLILGGFGSVPGAILGGPIIGAAEKLAEIYLGPYIGGGIEYWFAYVLALMVLLIKPDGLFSRRRVQRV